MWHARERKRLPAHLLPVVTPPPPPAPRVPTEAQWLSGDPGRMVRCVVRLTVDPRTVFHMTAPQVARKLRLYYCACARHRWELLPDDVRPLVETLERHAHGEGNGRTLRAARAAARAAQQAALPTWTPDGYSPGVWERSAAVGLVVSAAEVREQLQVWGSGWGSAVPSVPDQAGLLRELFGNPFRPAELDSQWLTSDVVRFARYIRAERKYELMPILGDALQDAGCDCTEVLEHCYEAHRHVAGCWLVDGLAG